MTDRLLIAFALGLPMALAGAGCTINATDKDTLTGDDDDDNAGDDDDDNNPGDDDDDDTNPGDDDDDNTNNQDSGGGGPGGGFDYLTVQADLGWDSTINQLVDVDLGSGQAAPPALYIIFGSETFFNAGWDFSLDTEYCFIVMPFTSSALATWAVSDPTVWYGVDYTGGIGGIATNCQTPGYEIAEGWGLGADPVDTIVTTYGGWGLGIGEFGKTWYNYYDPATTPDFFDTYVGARVYSAGGFFGPEDFLALPVEIDPLTYEAQDDGTYYLTVPASQVYTGTSIASAWYRIFPLYYYHL